MFQSSPTAEGGRDVNGSTLIQQTNSLKFQSSPTAEGGRDSTRAVRRPPGSVLEVSILAHR